MAFMMPYSIFVMVMGPAADQTLCLHHDVELNNTSLDLYLLIPLPDRRTYLREAPNFLTPGNTDAVKHM